MSTKVKMAYVPTQIEESFVEMGSDDWRRAATEYATVIRQIEWLEKSKEKLRAELLLLADGMNCMGAGLSIQRVIRQGNVDYKAIPELKSVDLDLYRKEKIETWRIIA